MFRVFLICGDANWISNFYLLIIMNRNAACFVKAEREKTKLNKSEKSCFSSIKELSFKMIVGQIRVH